MLFLLKRILNQKIYNRVKESDPQGTIKTSMLKKLTPPWPKKNERQKDKSITKNTTYKTKD